MYKIIINKKKCVDCGNCENILHKLFDNLMSNDEVYISAEDLNTHSALISKAIDKCYLDALTIEAYNG